ncbi:MAG: methyl-accepting chemotaxis protein [Candidatus Wallbacteria bacterium]|nr:methyl-accepting chemotaxis protein [Candidatus Wallbacteria bacterium]
MNFRCRYVVLRETQFNLVFSFLAMVLILVVITLSNLFMFSIYMRNFVLDEIEGKHLDLIIRAAIGAFQGRLVLLIVVETAILLILGIVISHRIAGPVFKIGRVLSDYAGGRFEERVVLRRADLLYELARSFNECFDTLRQRIRIIKNKASVLPDSEAKKDLVGELDFFHLPYSGDPED